MIRSPSLIQLEELVLSMTRGRNSNPMSLFAFQDIITATTGILILLALVLAISVIIQGAPAAVQTVFATDEELANRAALIADVDALKKKSVELAQETASLSFAAPSDLKQKIDSLVKVIDRLSKELPEYGKTIADQQRQLDIQQKSTTISQIESEIKRLKEEIADASATIDALKNGNRVVYNFRDVKRTPWLVEVAGRRILCAKMNSDQTQTFDSAVAFNRFAMSLPESERYIVMIVKPSGVANYHLIRDFLQEKDVDLGTELISEDQEAVHPQHGTRVK